MSSREIAVSRRVDLVSFPPLTSDSSRAPLRILLALFALMGLWAAFVAARAFRPLLPPGGVLARVEGIVVALDTARTAQHGDWLLRMRDARGDTVVFEYAGLREPPLWASTLRRGDSLELEYHRVADAVQVGPWIRSAHRVGETLLTPAQAQVLREELQGGRRPMVVLVLIVGVLSLGGLIRMWWTDRARRTPTRVAGA